MENKSLWKKYKEKNNQKAKEELIKKNIKLVKMIAGRLFSKYNGKVSFDDLVGYGSIGLIDAIEKFDHTRDIKFSTYANIRIRGAIIDQLRSIDWVPRSVRKKHKKYESALKQLQERYGDKVSDKQIADKMNMEMSEYYDFLDEISIYSVYSLDKKINDNIHFDIQSDYNKFQPEKALQKQELIEELTEAIEELNEREKKIVQLYYYSELTYKEIAEILDITQSRISQLHSKIITKLSVKLELGD